MKSMKRLRRVRDFILRLIMQEATRECIRIIIVIGTGVLLPQAGVQGPELLWM